MDKVLHDLLVWRDRIRLSLRNRGLDDTLINMLYDTQLKILETRMEEDNERINAPPCPSP